MELLRPNKLPQNSQIISGLGQQYILSSLLLVNHAGAGTNLQRETFTLVLNSVVVWEPIQIVSDSSAEI